MAGCSSAQRLAICSSNATDVDAGVDQGISIYKSCGDLESNSSKQDKMDEIAEVDVPFDDGSLKQTSGIDISGDFCTKDEKPDLKTFHTDAEVTKADGQLFLNEVIPDAASCNIETNDCKSLGKSEMGDSVCKKNSDMEPDEAVTVCKENGNVECSEAVTSVGVVAGERQGYYLKGTVLKLKQLEFNRKFDGGSDDFPSDSVALKKEMEYSTAIHYDGVNDGDNCAEGFPSPCLNAFTFELDVQEAHPHDATRGPSEALEIVSCSFGTDLAKPDCPFKGQAICHVQSSVSISENNMFLPKVSSVPATEAIEAIDQTKLGITNRVDHEETEADLANVVDCDEDYAWSCSSVTSEPIIFFPESKSPSDDGTRIKKMQELGLSIKSNVLGFEVLERDSGDSGTASDPCSQQMDNQKPDKEKAAECTLGNSGEHPPAETGLSFADNEKENNFFMEPLDELDHHCFQIKHFNDVSEPPSDGFDQQEVLQDQSKELTVSHASNGLPEKKVQISPVMMENKLVDFSCEEIKLNVPDKGVMYHQTAQEFFLRGDMAGLGGASSCTQRYAAPEDTKTSCSVDFTSQTDDIVGHRASISDTTVPSEKHVTDVFVLEAEMSDQHASSFRKKGDKSEINFMDIFEAPSFATLIEPDMQRPPSEIQTMPEKQLTRSSPSVHPERQSEEIFANISNCSPGRHLVPLKVLLDEANRESRRRMLHARDRSLSSRATKVPVSRRTSGESTSTVVTKYQKECFVGVDERVWNSPARLPMVRKRNARARLPWRPFICCPSLKEGAYC
ncbi:hypothetical protein DsansV1_C08g0081991 [Dioscorea sansibarensis]